MSNEDKKGSRFEVVEKSGSMLGIGTKILKDKITGVHYLFAIDGYAGGLTPLLDENGKPFIEK